MTQTFDIAVIGATGTVGETLVQILEELDFPVGALHLLAGSNSAGASVPFRGKNVRVKEVDEFDFNQVKLAFFAAGPAATLSFAPRATAAGCAVIDLSGALPAEPVVPEANAQVLDGLKPPFQLGSPSPSVTNLAVVLAPLRGVLDIQRVNVTASLAMSAQGREAVSELARQTAELLNMRPLEPQFFDRQVAFNLLAQVGTPDAEGHTALEKRLVHELRAVLGMPSLKISAACVQAPVFFGDSLTVSLQLGGAVDLAAVNRVLDSAPGIELVEDGDFPTAVGDAVGQDVVYVGRVRAGVDDPAELNLWLTSDNVRKGSALNAVQLAQLLIKRLV
ncbi:aspartate-semialdehyde dehydrogenase [Pseudomonas sp. SDO524_S393]